MAETEIIGIDLRRVLNAFNAMTVGERAEIWNLICPIGTMQPRQPYFLTEVGTKSTLQFTCSSCEKTFPLSEENEYGSRCRDCFVVEVSAMHEKLVVEISSAAGSAGMRMDLPDLLDWAANRITAFMGDGASSPWTDEMRLRAQKLRKALG